MLLSLLFDQTNLTDGPILIHLLIHLYVYTHGTLSRHENNIYNIYLKE